MTDGAGPKLTRNAVWFLKLLGGCFVLFVLVAFTFDATESRQAARHPEAVSP